MIFILVFMLKIIYSLTFIPFIFRKLRITSFLLTVWRKSMTAVKWLLLFSAFFIHKGINMAVLYRGIKSISNRPKIWPSLPYLSIFFTFLLNVHDFLYCLFYNKFLYKILKNYLKVIFNLKGFLRNEFLMLQK